MNSEIEQIKERYARRKSTQPVKKNSGSVYFSHFAQAERELVYTRIIHERFSDTGNIRLLEIGAGAGGNLFYFNRLGLSPENIFANELLEDRISVLKQNFPAISIYEGDASELNLDNDYFDIVFQSTVFTSILDTAFRKKLAKKIWDLTKPGGIVLWYDFMYDNPSNKDVKGIGKKEILDLFPESPGIKFYKVTLAPPVARRIKRLYPFFNLFPFLRTHLIAVIEKPF